MGTPKKQVTLKHQNLNVDKNKKQITIRHQNFKCGLKNKKNHMHVLSFSWSLREANAHTSFFLSWIFFPSFFIFWKSYICEPRCVENTLAHTHIGASCLVMAHTKCACVFHFCFLKSKKQELGDGEQTFFWQTSKHTTLQSHYSWKLQIYQNWNLFHLYNGGSTHRPLVAQICKSLLLITSIPSQFTRLPPLSFIIIAKGNMKHVIKL